MHYFSTKRRSPHASFREAVLRGQPDDHGLYFPSEIPRHSAEFVSTLGQRSKGQIAFDCMRPFVAGEIPDERLFEICEETVDFDFPLVQVTDRIFALELFHGPTLAFKDVGARFLSRCLQYFRRDATETSIVLVATSGDTGGAVAAGFHGIEGTEVVILFPKGKVSRIQELQLTTLGGNVTPLVVDGTFDDCQALAKRALADPGLQEKADLTSANSINIARWLPQQFYYFYAQQQWEGEPPVIAVPSGNFGNLASGMLASITGLPVTKFIAACNANDVIPRFLETEDYSPRASIQTLSNAMDVGDPSNFVRILELFDQNYARLKAELLAVSVSDEATAATMRDAHDRYDYLLDPHGAIGFRALSDHLELNEGAQGLFLETAHPVKFDSVSEIIGRPVDIPPAIEDMLELRGHGITLRNDYAELKEVLLSKV